MEGVSACLAHGSYLSDLVHDTRVKARKIVARWAEHGTPSRLIDVQLAPYDYWRGSREPVLHVIVKGLSNLFEPMEKRVMLESARDLEKEMEANLPELKAAFTNRTALAAHGASGTVTRLALNAMSIHGSVSVGTLLMVLATRDRLELADGTVVAVRHGHVGAGTGDASYPDWWDEHFNVKSIDLSPDEERRAIGRPLSELIERDFLSDDILATAIEQGRDDDGSFVTIHFTNPTLLFCSTTGRVWSDPDDLPLAIPQDNVVPFRTRTG